MTLIELGDRFRLEGAADPGPFAFADLLPGEEVGGARTLRLKGRPGWRLIVSTPLPAGWQTRLPRPQRYGRWVDRAGLWRSVAAFGVVAIALVLVAIRAPHWLAPLVPRSAEARIGDLMVGDFGDRYCNGPGGAAALAHLKARLDPDGLATDIHVVSVPIVNAVTLPGGRIVLFDPIVRQARSPDEVAGVIAHELGHVRNRDVMESLLREMGLSVLLGGMEGHVGNATNVLLSASYTREAEARADAFAIDDLHRARISPAPTADFFRRLAGHEGEDDSRMLAYLSTHPLSKDRAHRFAAAAQPGAVTQPALSPADWQALQQICASDPHVKRGSFFGF